MNSEFLFIGHRGTRNLVDENTIAAFEKAIEFGANYIEFDVRKTKDGKLIILHDPTIDRTTNSSGFLKNLSYDDIKEFRTKINSQPLPLLSEVLSQLKGKVRFMIELKETDLKENILEIVNENKVLDECIFSGRNLQELGEFKVLYHKSQICYNITKGLDFNLNEFLKFQCFRDTNTKPSLISLRSNLVTKKFIDTCHKFEIKSLAWDFISYQDPIFHIKSLIDLGIDGILFDDHRNITKIKQWLYKK